MFSRYRYFFWDQFFLVPVLVLFFRDQFFPVLIPVPPKKWKIPWNSLVTVPNSREFSGTGTKLFRYWYRYFLPGPNFSGTDLETVNKGDNMLSLFLSGEVRVAFVFIKDQYPKEKCGGRVSIIYSIKWWTRTFKVSTKKLLRMWQRMAKTWGQISATNVSMNLLGLAIWGVIWKDTVEKNQTNAINVTMHPLRQVNWRDIWKHTVEKSQTNATNVTMHHPRQALWGDICRRTVGKSQTNATSAIMHALIQVL